MTDVKVTSESLERVGVKLLDKFRIKLQCMTCGMIWQPVPFPELRLPRNWWHCPRGCNRNK